ncbi:unnamed protein product [Lampetra fluviatilis]
MSVVVVVVVVVVAMAQVASLPLTQADRRRGPSGGAFRRSSRKSAVQRFRRLPRPNNSGCVPLPLNHAAGQSSRRRRRLCCRSRSSSSGNTKAFVLTQTRASRETRDAHGSPRRIEASFT